VEDGAQCLDSGQPAWGDWRLFSPRKLFGVPEGGLLVPLSDSARSAGLTGPAKPSDPALSDQRRRPMDLRRKHPQDNALWHPAHQAVEAMGEVSDRAMDPAALALLTSLDPMPMIAARRANFAILAQHLANFAVLPEGAPEFAPFGFPVRLPAQSRDQVLQQLHAQGIFPAVHWRDIAAPLSFAADHARAATLATLPCDHRYGRPEMERVADAFLRALS
jgi:dTDP-4-amino-4,6-dideoxygalactose transaminase